MRPCKCFTLLAITLLHVQAFCQHSTNIIDSLKSRVIQHIRNDNQEHVILQTDRAVYAPGEKIWLNALVVHKKTNRLSTSCKNLFVDLVNDKDSVIKQVVLNAAAFNTNGVLTIGDAVDNGYYWLRGYTSKMLGENASDMYVHPIFIINKNKTNAQSGDKMAAFKQTAPTNRPVLLFYPEGGTLVTGIQSTLVIKATDIGGNPLSVAGYVENDADSIVANFTTNKLGLARASFYPEGNHAYSATLQQGGGAKYPLPAFNPFAGQVAITSQNDDWINVVVTLEDSIYSKFAATYLLGVSGDSVCYAAIGKGMYNVSIPVSNFPGGVATLLLFNQANQLLSERKVFINKNNYTVSLKANKKNYAAREKVDLAVTLTSPNGEPLVGALNISVLDERAQTLTDAMETDTLQPAGTLNEWLNHNSRAATPADIDMLMIAQPPQFNDWAINSTAANVDSAIENNEQTELLTYLHGRLTGRRNKPLKGMVVTEILQNKKDFFFEVDTTNAEGKFRLPLPQGRDSLLLNLQVTEKGGFKDTDNNITIDRFMFPSFTTPAVLKQKFFTGAAMTPRWLRTSYTDTMFSNAAEGWLKPVIVSTVMEKKENYDVSKRSDPLSSIITSDMLKRGGYQNFVGNALLMVPGVSLSQGFINIYGGDGRGGTANSEPLLIVDGAPIATGGIMAYLNNLSWRDIDFIEVLTGGNAAIYGMRGGNGVVLVNTKTRYQQSLEMENGFKLVNPVTYHIAPAFKMPNYADKLVKNNSTPDTRNTIFWQGGIITDTEGKASVNFYTADAATKYVVTVTGITQHGDKIYKRMAIDRK